MSQELAKQEGLNYAQMLEKVVTKGDLSALSEGERAKHYLETCESLKLNWRTSPFGFFESKDKQTGQKKITLYAKKDCAEQLRKRDSVTIRVLSQTYDDATGIFTVHVEAELPNGRKDEDMGCASLKGISAEDRASAIMKAMTKAKRRVSLSICGLGIPDESDLDSIPGAKRLETSLEVE